jgi:hypothetical protein
LPLDAYGGGEGHALDAVRELQAQCAAAVEQLRRGVDIQQEDHGKAILALTIVTVVFLPLSFMSSFFGMNTADVRTLGSSQWLFWATALPLTALVLAGALTVGFKGDALRERIVLRLRRVGARADAVRRVSWTLQYMISRWSLRFRTAELVDSSDEASDGDMSQTDAAEMSSTTPSTSIERMLERLRSRHRRRRHGGGNSGRGGQRMVGDDLV